MTEPLVLHTSDDRVTITLSKEALTNAFEDAFSTALSDGGLFNTKIQALVDIQEDFAVVFCGSSYMSPILRSRVAGLISRWQTIAQDHGVTIRHCFLSNVDTAATTGIACGAALAVMRVPPLAQVMRSAAVGIQVLRRVKHQSELINDNVLQ
jgi:hypothetical protein